MDKFYCNVCEEEVTLKDGKCPICKTNWKKIMSESEKEVGNEPVREINNDSEYVFVHDITDDDIQENINFFLSWATIVEIFLYIVAGIIVLIAFAEIGATEGSSLLLIFPALGTALVGLILKHSLKWRAYMLHTNYKRKK